MIKKIKIKKNLNEAQAK